MRTISLLILLTVYPITELLAQAESMRDSTSFAGRKAIVFSVSGLIGSIQISGGLGGKYWISNEYFLKSILSGSYGRTEFDYGIGDHYENISLNIYVDRKLSSDQKLIPYVGLGAGFHWSERAYDHGYLVQNGDVGYSIILLCGIEYMILEKISLSVEQMVSATYYHDRMQGGRTTWNVGNSTSNMSLSIYF